MTEILHGVLLIRKTAGMTSHDVVAQIRKIFQTKKVGHAGTLDPFATGLLLLCLGDATRIVQYLTDGEKTYRAVMKLGERTDTQDYTGKIIERRDVPALTTEDVEGMFARFTGEIAQVPPMYSARRVQGQRLYELARAGKEVEREARPVTIRELTLTAMTLPYLHLQVVCSKGTYIRALANDLGEAFGCGAHLTELERTQSGRFLLHDAMSLEELVAMRDDRERLRRCLLPIDAALAEWPSLTLDETAAGRIAHGAAVALPTEAGEMLPSRSNVRVHNQAGTLLALAWIEYLPETEEASLLSQIHPFMVFAKP
ncbi:tRNA pseudouridine synthase B 1 [Candidatus Moduliflexus flocculans]|uniref:tRNA pseudouridine synthase B n=1 Tax=Candidatus Moduliflexus flocculans TaxID=1499966 RepID=A0A081BPZ2_9BACT|nr:tRNA pseudouridine synthase B 1 [Candidatus Moduliflexus flocculans]